MSKLNTFSFRAECQHDITSFVRSCIEKGIDVVITCNQQLRLVGGMDVPDREVELLTTHDLETLRSVLREIIDSHVMIETLRPVPIHENSFGRDPSFQF